MHSWLHSFCSDELFESCKLNHTKEARHMLDDGVDVNMVDENGQNALHIVASEGKSRNCMPVCIFLHGFACLCIYTRIHVCAHCTFFGRWLDFCCSQDTKKLRTCSLPEVPKWIWKTIWATLLWYVLCFGLVCVRFFSLCCCIYTSVFVSTFLLTTRITRLQHIAARHDNLKVAKELVENHAEISLVNNEGLAPIDVAAKHVRNYLKGMYYRFHLLTISLCTSLLLLLIFRFGHSRWRSFFFVFFVQ